MAAEAPADVLGELAAALPAGALLTDPDVVAGYRQDWAKDPLAGWPLAVVERAAPPMSRPRSPGPPGTGSRSCPAGPAPDCPGAPARSTAASSCRSSGCVTFASTRCRRW